MLELNFNPENSYSRGTMSAKKRGFFLAVKVRRRKKPTGPVHTEADYRVEILGQINVFHEFQGMIDFQYLPMRRSAKNGEYESILPKLVPKTFEEILNWPLLDSSRPDECDELFLPPYCFSRFMRPSTLALSREVQHQDERVRELQARKDIIGSSTRKLRKSTGYMLAHSEEFPTEPAPIAVKVADERCKDLTFHKKIVDLFQEKPLWSRNALLYKLGIRATADELLKYVVGIGRANCLNVII